MQLVKWFKPKKTITPPPSRPLEPMLLARFKRVLHTQQLDIFANVLQLSLVNLQDTLSRKVLGKDAYEQKITLFDKTVDELYHGIIRLNDQLTKEGAWDRTPRRNLLLTIFVFYRILFRDLLTHLSPAGNHSSTQDRYSLIKRIPPQVIYQAGAEYWRLYELATLIYGDLDDLRLNRDLKPILQTLFEDEAADLSSSPDSSIATLSTKETASPSNEKSTQHTKDAIAFLEWLEAKILNSEKGFELNADRVFVDTLSYDERTLFIAESVLTEFKKADPPLLLAGLDALERLEGTVHQRYQITGFELSLIRLFVDFDLNDMDITEPVIIEPVT